MKERDDRPKNRKEIMQSWNPKDKTVVNVACITHNY